MTEKQFLRISPSGKFVGDPALTVGPGMPGQVYRQHGTLGTATAITASAPLEIEGLDKMTPVAAVLEPGYLYELKLDTEVKTSTVTTAGTFYPVFALRNAATNVWGPWFGLGNGEHYVDHAALSSTYCTLHYVDDLQDLAVTATANAIAFGVVANLDNQLDIYGTKSFARVEEYTAAP
jgi:hypothetical protein